MTEVGYLVLELMCVVMYSVGTVEVELDVSASGLVSQSLLLLMWRVLTR